MKSKLEQAGKPVEYFEFEDLDHSLRESAARQKMLAEMDRFISNAFSR